MKQSIKFVAAAALFSLGISSFSFAQNIASVKTASSENLVISDAENNSIENAAEASFSSLFPNASQQKWTATADNSFVSFLNEGRKARASFNTKGSLNYVITDCGINNLPAAFSKKLNDNYSGYKLFHAIEIKAYGETAYQAVMENASSFVTLKFTTDGMEELQQVKK